MKKSNSVILLGISFFSFLFSLSLILYNLLDNEFSIKFVLVSFSLFLLFQLFLLFVRGEIYTIYFFYILLSFFFIFDRIFLYFINPIKYNWLRITFPYEHVFPSQIGIKYITISFISFITISIIYFYSKTPKKINICNLQISEEYNNCYNKIGMGLMLFSIFPLLYKYYIQVNFIRQFPTYAMANFAYTGPGPVFPIWTRGAGGLFIIGFLLFLYSGGDLKHLKLALFLFFIQQVGNSLKGGRSMLFCYIITVPLLIRKQYNKKLKTSIFIIVGIISILFAIFLQSFRMNSEDNAFDSGFLLSFLNSQTMTIGGPYIYLDNEGHIPYHNYPFIFSPIINLMDGSGSLEKASLARLGKINSLSLTTTYLVSPKMYFQGFGVGQNFLIETYDCGKYLGVILWSVILGILMLIIDRAKPQKGFALCFLFYLYQYTLFLPRNTFFGFLRDMKYIVVLFIILYFFDLFFRTVKMKRNVYKKNRS